MKVRGLVLTEGTGMLLYHLATKIKSQIIEQLSFLIKYVVTKKLDSTLRIDKAIEYLISNINNVNLNEFEKYCGVGVVVSPEEIEKTVESLLSKHKKELLEKRYRFNVGQIMQQVRTELPWADGKAVKSEVDVQVNKQIKKIILI